MSWRFAFGLRWSSFRAGERPLRSNKGLNVIQVITLGRVYVLISLPILLDVFVDLDDNRSEQRGGGNQLRNWHGFL